MWQKYFVLILIFLFCFNLTQCSKTFEGSTILHWAVYSGHNDLVKILVEKKKVNLNSKDKEGKTPLFLAAETENRDIMLYLIDKGANIFAKDNLDMTVMHHIARNGYIDILLSLKDALPEDSYYELINIKDKYKYLPIHWAYLEDHKDIVIELLSSGSPFNIKDSNDYTLLHWASENGYTDIMHYLLKNNVDVNAKDKSGNVPLHLAADGDHKQAVELLIQYGADVNIPWPDKFLF